MSKTYWIDEQHGDDANDGLTPETALKTQGEALRRCEPVLSDAMLKESAQQAMEDYEQQRVDIFQELNRQLQANEYE